MTDAAVSLPADLRRWLAGHLPAVATVTDASWTRPQSRVWRVETPTTTAYLKVSPSEQSYIRETAAYRQAADALGHDHSPRLIATDPALRVADLVSRQVHRAGRCACGGRRPACGGRGEFLFLGADTGHHRRSNYARRVFQPAAHGRFPGQRQNPDGRGLRHGLKTWMAENGIPEILQADRLGHIVPGIRGVYTHVSDAMRDELKTRLQRRWEQSLDERAKAAPGSPLPILAELLATRREGRARVVPLRSA